MEGIEAWDPLVKSGFPESSKRKRYSPAAKKLSSSARSKKIPVQSPAEQSTSSSSTPNMIVDQLYQRYKTLKIERVSTNQIETSQKDPKSQTSQISPAKKAAIKLKRKSLEVKSSELKKKKTEFCKSQIEKEKEQKCSVETVNKAWEIVQFIYEDIKYMLKKEGCFDQHFSEVSEMKTVIIERLKKNNEKLKVPCEEVNLETEISVEKYELENLIKTRWSFKEEEEKLQNSDEVFSVKSVEQKLDSIEGSIKNLNDKEIGLENVLQGKTEQNLEENNKFSRDQQALEAEFNDLETELQNLGDVDEMLGSAYLKIKEMILRKLNPDTEIEKDLFTGEIQEIEAKVRELEIKSNLQKASVDFTNQLLKLESGLIDSKNAINLILSKNIDVDSFDKSLMEVNKELELLQNEQVSKENELRNQELEELVRQQEKNNQENVEILQKLNQDLKYEKEESIIRDLESDFSQKEKVKNEVMENYNNMKQANSEHLEKNPNLLETKSLKDFVAMKKKLEAAVSSAQQREKTTEKRYEIKLKDLEHKIKKYLAALKEVDQEFNSTKEKSKDYDFASLQKKIKEAEEKLQKKKKDLMKKVLPVITKSEPVKIDLETLSLIKTLTKKLPEKQEYALFSDDETVDSDIRFDRLSKTYQVDPVKLTKNQETMKKKSENDEILFPLTQGKALSPEADLGKEDDFFPLSQARGLNFFSKDHSEDPREDEFSFPLTQGKNEKTSSQTSFDELRAEYGKSPKNEKSVFPNSQQPSSQRSFEYESQKKDKIVSRPQSKVDISTPAKGRAVKEAEKERVRSTERKFFKSSSQTLSKSYKRSKSVPPRKF